MKRLLLTVLLALVVGGIFGWRANITFEPEPIKYVPVRVRDTLSYYHWYMHDWPPVRRP